MEPSILADLGKRTLIMGIVNVTPDSFSDGGLFNSLDHAHAHGRSMMEAGADILDIGGESTRPGASPVAEAEEIRRVLPIIKALANDNIPLSIDSYKAGTVRAALEAGAGMINDVWGLQREPIIASLAAEHGVPVIIMHNRHGMDAPIDIIEDMKTWFDRSLTIAHAAGIRDDRIILDPGIGFGKSLEQNLQAINALPFLKSSFGYPVLVGLSRKSFIGHLTGIETPKERLHGTLAAHTAAIFLGADIIRVHDVGPHFDAVRIIDALLRHRRG